MESKERCPPGAHWPGTRDLSKSCPVGTLVRHVSLVLQGRWRRFDGNCRVAPGGSTATCTSASIVFPFCRLGGGRTRNCRLTPAEQSMALSLRSIKHLIGCVKTHGSGATSPPLCGGLARALFWPGLMTRPFGKDLHGNSARYLQLKYPILAIKLMSRKAMMCSRKLLNMSVLCFVVS